MSTPRKPYPGGVTGDEGALVAPSLTLTTAGVPQRRHDPRGFFNAVRWLVRTGSPRRCPPNDLPPWPAVSQQTRRWLAAGCFEAVVDDLRALLRVAAGRDPEPAAVVLGGRTPRSTRERGHRAGADGHKRTKGSKRHASADTLGHLPAARSTPANAQERAQVEAPAAAVQVVTGDNVEPAYVDQGDTGEESAAAAAAHGIALEVVRLPEAKRGFVLLPRRRAVERSVARAARFRRPARTTNDCPERWSACTSSPLPAPCFTARWPPLAHVPNTP